MYANIIVPLMGIAALIGSVNSYCPDSQTCVCTTEYIKCICPRRETIIFDEDENFAGKEIVIKDCGVVELRKHSLQSIYVESILISNVLELNIEPHAFLDSDIKNLYIYNITGFRLESLGLGNIKNLANLIISNATLENIVAAVLGGTEVQNVTISDSHIGTISSRALHLQNLEYFVMENNAINAFDITSISIKNCTKFNFIHNSVYSTSFGSISVVRAKKVEFGFCSFKKIHSSMTVTKDVEIYDFHDNNIEFCEERAFWSIQAIKQIRFVNNQISVAKEDSVLPNTGPNSYDYSSIIMSHNNSFICDCEIDWLFTVQNKEHDLIKESNVCYEPSYLTGLKLSQLTLTMDKVGTCIDILASTTTSPSTTTLTTERKTSLKTFTTKSEYFSTGFSAGSPTQINNITQPSRIKAMHSSLESCASIYKCNYFLFYTLVFMYAIFA